MQPIVSLENPYLNVIYQDGKKGGSSLSYQQYFIEKINELNILTGQQPIPQQLQQAIQQMQFNPFPPISGKG